MSKGSIGVDGSLESLVGQVADDFLRRQRDGERPDVEEYIARYPQAADMLRPVLASLRLLECSRSGQAATVLEEAPAEVEGTLGDFRILREVGRGGMGVVYEAVQISLGRHVALKVLPFAAALDERQLQRFKNEAQAAAGLHHTNIVPVYAVGCERGVHFYAMQLINGQTLASVIAELRQRENGAAVAADPQCTSAYLAAPAAVAASAEVDTPLGQALSTQHSTRSVAYFRSVARLGLQAAEALEHAHQVGVVHRDIKPGNLMVDVRGNLWVTDFGLAYIHSDTRLTMSGDLVGTLRYMSPEQALAQRVGIDQRTDIYSLGATLYELLTLKPVFDGHDRQELLRQIAFDEPQAPRRINKAIPGELETIVLKALAKSPAERYSTAQELADDLGRFLRDEPIRARRPSLVQRMRRWARRHRPLVASLASVAALLVVAVVAGALLYAAWRVRTNETITAALTDAVHFEAQGQFARARELARRAETLTESSVADAGLVARVRQLRARLDAEEKDSRMLARLEEACLGDFWDNRPYRKGAAADYTAAFQEYGIDVETLAAEEAVRLIQDRPIQTHLIAAIDDWARGLEKGPAQKHLRAIARTADRDRWRTQVRDAFARRDLPAMKKLSTSADVMSQPALSLWLLGKLLGDLGDRSAAVDLLRRAQQHHPGDYGINSTLAIYLYTTSPADLDESLRFFTAALVARPQRAGAHSNLGIALKDKGKVEEAIACYHKAIALDPKNARIHTNLGNGLRDKGDVEGAIHSYQEAIRLDPKDAVAHNNLGNALKDKGQVEEAIACYKKALALDPKLAMAHNNLGNALKDKGQVEEAIPCFRMAIALDPKLAGAHNNLGHALEAKGQVEEAISYYQKAIELDPKLAGAHDKLGVALAGKGKVEEAIACFQKAIDLNPKLASAHNNLGYAMYGKRKMDEAIACYRKAIALDPKYARAHTNLGYALKDKDKWDEAIACFKKAIALDPKNAGAHNHLGNALKDKGQVEEAIACFHKALALDSKFAIAHMNLALALKDKGQEEEAIACFRKALALDPKYANAHTGLGLALYARGKVDEAIACYRKAIEVDPNYAPAHTGLGVILCDVKHDYDGAIACFRKALALEPKSTLVYFNLGVALAGKGKVDETIECYQKVIALDRRHAYAHLTLGVALRDKGKLDEGIACFKRAIQIDPRLYHAYAALGQTLMQQGHFGKAQEALRRCLELIPASHPLRAPISGLLQRCRQQLDIDGKLKAFLAGKGAPADAVSQLQMAIVAVAPVNKRYRTAALLYREAFARQPELAGDHRYNAACCAALAGCGQGKGASQLAFGVRLVWRKQALAWLQADLAARREQLKGEVPGQAVAAHQALEHWLRDPDLAGVRELNHLTRLPVEEGEAWFRLWVDVTRALQGTD
jgi:tetratricopeptide (TPR) repeat protein